MQKVVTLLVFVCVAYQSATVPFADAVDGKSYTLTFFEQETAIRRNRWLCTLDVLPKEFDVSFDFYATKWGPPFHKSILHMTTGSNCCGVGSRIPAVLGHYGYIGVYFALNGGGSNCYTATNQPTKKWIHIRIAQIRERRVTGDVYVYAIYFDGKLLQSTVNKKAQEFRNVKVFAGSDFYSPQPGFIKNLRITAVPFAVDGKWGPWSAYSDCSKECGDGIRKQTRTCSAPKYGGKPCVGSAENSQPCNKKPCPVDGKWGPWSAFSDCSKECGGGIRSRTRTCIPPKFGGKPCDGSVVNSQPCNEDPCPVPHTTPRVPKCNKYMEVGILLDSSGSIRDYYGHEKRFLIALADSLDMGSTGSRVGVITFSHKAVYSIKLKNHKDMNSFTQAVERIPLMKSITRIDLAFKMAARKMFKANNEAEAKKLLILLTDGVQSKVTGATDPAIVANTLRRRGVTVMAVGMGLGVKISELDRITNGHAYTARTFQELVSDKFIRELTGETCKVG